MTPKRSSKSRNNAAKNLTPWQPGTSGNPNGRPRKVGSWKEIITEIMHMTGPEIAQHYAAVARPFKQLPREVTIKELIVARAAAGLLNDTNTSLFRELMDRMEGKVQDQPQATGGTLHWIGLHEMLEKVYGDKAMGISENGKPDNQEPTTEAGLRLEGSGTEKRDAAKRTT